MVPPVTAERSPPDSRITGAHLAGDRRLVDRGDALDHLAVAGDDVAGLDQDQVARLEVLGRSALVELAIVGGAAAASPAWWCGWRAGRRPAPCRGPRPPPRRSWRRSSVNQSQRMIWKLKPRLPAPVARSRRKRTVVRSATTSTTNITGLRIIGRGSSLPKAEPSAGTTISGAKQGGLGSGHDEFRSEGLAGRASPDARRRGRGRGPGSR